MERCKYHVLQRILDLEPRRTWQVLLNEFHHWNRNGLSNDNGDNEMRIDFLAVDV